MSTVPADGEHLLDLLRSRHAVIMEGRPDNNPGRFKTATNRVGSRVFVVSEVHPFDAGNGRLARVLMNAELVAAGQARILIPTVYRNNYLASLRGMSVNGHADGLIATLAFAQRWRAQVDVPLPLDAAVAVVSATQRDDL